MSGVPYETPVLLSFLNWYVLLINCINCYTLWIDTMRSFTCMRKYSQWRPTSGRPSSVVAQISNISTGAIIQTYPSSIHGVNLRSLINYMRDDSHEDPEQLRPYRDLLMSTTNPLWTPTSFPDQKPTFYFGFAFRYVILMLEKILSKILRDASISTTKTLSLYTTEFMHNWRCQVNLVSVCN